MTLESTRGFQCINCHKWVPVNEKMGTHNRNHCPSCLWSRHVDLTIAGDRLSSCDSGMKPIALTLKNKGVDKYGKKQSGELMIVHNCFKCNKVSINRIAADDNTDEILKLLDLSLNISEELKNKLKVMDIIVVDSEDRVEVENQIFGKK